MSSLTQSVLAGDVGGTKTLLALAHWDAGRLRIEREARFTTGDYATLTPMVREFLAGAAPRAACFGLACPISGRRIKLTNTAFWIDADEIAHDCGIAQVRLINDFAAIGYGLDALAASELEVLQKGATRPQAPRALLGAGTGLGQAILVWQNDRYEVLSTEGGHVDFAPANEAQIDLWRALSTQYGHVSYERVLSGQGLSDIFHHLAASRSPSPELLTALQNADPAAVISEFGLSRRDPVAAATLELFAQIYGQQAGNLALTTFAEGGVYIAGGIAPKLIQLLKADGFMEAFRAKGRYREWLSNLQVAVVMNQKVGLLGAVVGACRIPE